MIFGGVEGPIRWSNQIRTALDSTFHNALHTARDRNRWRKIVREKVMQKGGHAQLTTLSTEEYDARRNKSNFLFKILLFGYHIVQKNECIGATHSNLVLCNENGTVIGRAKGPGTNHWSLGIEECANRVVKMVHDAKEDAGIPLDKPLDSLGLTLSGCSQDSSNAELAAKVKEKDNACANAIYVATDTAGSLYTGAPNGGMVLIAGTGSNALLLTVEGKQHGCGGWGHLLGDEGGAYWIAHKAVKAVFDDVDGLRPSPHCTRQVWQVIQDHFNVDNRDDLLPHAYKHFEKPFFAGLTSKLSKLATEGDALSRHVFGIAGSALAAHAVALCSRTDATLLRVVCVGSVWNSWDLLKPGFLSELKARKVNTKLELVRLRVSSAMGAAWLAAKHVGSKLPRDDTAFCQIFYTYTPDTTEVNGKSTEVNGKSTDDNGDTAEVNGCDANGVNGKHNVELNGKSLNSVTGNMNGHHGMETCGCDDWRSWS